MSTTEKFLELIDKLKSNGDVRSAVDLGMKVEGLYTQKVTNMRSGKNKVTTDILEEFFKAFPHLNANYLFKDGEAPLVSDRVPARLISGATLIGDSKREELEKEIICLKAKCDEKDAMIERLMKMLSSKA